MQTVSPELSARVMRLLDKGLTYSQIAGRIGRTKNAVAGIVHRVRNPTPPKHEASLNLDISFVSDLPKNEARYILAVTLGLGYAKTAKLFGLTPFAIRYSCHKIEDQRDDYDYDQRLEALEADKIRQAGQTTELARALQDHPSA